ncbi:MAG TPA: sigma-70 family RNA polymerase sigma factor [Candidatus Atribacteria bacterium]|nr:sigma-70 family RNA polymerase sigma factor [Candidatus Atribacteria bacterium]
MDIPIEKVQDIQRIIKRKVIYINTGPESKFVYQIPDYHEWSSPEYELHLEDLKNYLLKNILNDLSEKEREILKLRYGLEDGKERSLEEVAYHFGITRERIRQIIQRIKKKLRSSNRRKKLEKLYKFYIR